MPPLPEEENRPLEHDAAVELGRFRPYLMMLARLEFDDALQAKFDASDIVQQTLLEAHQGIAQYRGQTDREITAWLRKILARNMVDELRKFRRQKRNVQLEASLAAALDESTMRVERLLADDGASPSMCAAANEQVVAMADALMRLPDDQRCAIQLHHLHGHTSAEVAARMERTEIAVAGLLRRGLKRLREFDGRWVGFGAHDQGLQVGIEIKMVGR